MNKKTKQALVKSIAKWKRLADGGGTKGEWLSADECPLCQLFFIGRPYNLDCFGCPVFEKTGKKACRDTPYAKAWFAAERNSWNLQSSEFKAAAQKEYEFLKSLLPKEEE